MRLEKEDARIEKATMRVAERQITVAEKIGAHEEASSSQNGTAGSTVGLPPGADEAGTGAAVNVKTRPRRAPEPKPEAPEGDMDVTTVAVAASPMRPFGRREPMCPISCSSGTPCAAYTVLRNRVLHIPYSPPTSAQLFVEMGRRHRRVQCSHNA